MQDLITKYNTEHRHPNILSYYKGSPYNLNKDGAFLLRQFVCFNLNEKLDHIPQGLTIVEKKWLIFQLLSGLQQIHSVSGMVHGDIKPDNVLVTSYDWLYIADMHRYKPIVVMDDDLKKYNMYFGYLDNNKKCYLAPERWLTPPQTIEDSKMTLQPSMDIFSAGCVIVEILSDGEPLFDLAKLQNYRRDKLDLKEELTRLIQDDEIVELVQKMLARDPTQRPTASECIDEWCDKVFPDSFKDVFFHIGAAFQRTSYLYSDNRISLIRYQTNAIFDKCFNSKNAVVTEEFNEPIEPSLFRLLEDDNTVERHKDLIPQTFKFYHAADEISEESKNELSLEKKQEQIHSATIVIHWIGQLFNQIFYPQTKIVALEMIEKLAKHLPFSIRLHQVLPYIAKTFSDSQSEGSGTAQSASRIKVKSLEVLLALFKDMIDCTDEIIVQPFDFKVFQNYIMPIIKKLMDQSKGDPMIRYSLAQNLALVAQIGTRLLEVAQASSIKLRQDVRNRREQMQNVRDSVDVNIANKELEKALRTREKEGGENRLDQMMTSSMVSSRRVTYLRNRTGTDLDTISLTTLNQQQYDASLEDIVPPNFDAELKGLWQEICGFIESFCGEELDSNSLIAMLKNLSELGNIFGAEKGEYLISQCISSINRHDYQVKIQVLKTLSSLCLRVGQEKVAKNVLPLTESVLNDPEDLVVIQNIKMLNQFVQLRLVTQQQCLTILEQLLPFLLHPNKQIRFQVAHYITLLATIGHDTNRVSEVEVAGVKMIINNKPLFPVVDFYSFVRPKLLIFALNQSDFLDIKCENDVLVRLRPPLSLRVMRKYFQELSAIEDKTQQEYFQKETEFSKREELSDSDTFAFTYLSGYFKERLNKMRSKHQTLKYHPEQAVQENMNLQRARRTQKLYRVVNASAITKLSNLDKYISTKSKPQKFIPQSQAQANEQLKLVQSFQPNKSVLFDIQHQVKLEDSQKSNYGLNLSKEERKGQIRLENSGMTEESEEILRALNIVPNVAETKTLNYQWQSTKQEAGNVSQALRVGSEIRLTKQAAQPSVLPHFDFIDRESVQEFQITDEHQRDYKTQKPQPIRTIRPQGFLVTTLYEHRNPVNTITVTDDQKYFLTGSREDKMVHVWRVNHIEEDVTSRSIHSFSTNASRINQICMIENTQSVAVGGSSGLQIFDLNRTLSYERESESQNSGRKGRRGNQNEIQDDITKIELDDEKDEVTQCLNMITPIQNGQHLLCATTQRGHFFMQDLRSRSHVINHKDLFGCQRGAVTSMTLGSDPYQLTLGTLGGYVMVYDIRYSLISTLYRHNMNYPILALATYKKQEDQQFPTALVSSGGSNYEVSQLNLETGIVETLFRCCNPSQDHELGRHDIPTIPEFIHETNFKDSKLGTLRRETNYKQFSRQIHAIQNHEEFSRLLQNSHDKYIKNIDSQLLVASKDRLKLISESCQSQNACRSILIPSSKNQKLFNNMTATYAITGGNDKKIRYWNLNDPSRLSFQVNSSKDEEAVYMSERMTNNNTLVVQEKQLGQQEFPGLSATKLQDQLSTSQHSFFYYNNKNVIPKYAENTAYSNAIASTINKQIALPGSGQAHQQANNIELSRMLDKMQTERGQGDQLIIRNMNGLSQGQHLNNLGICTNGSSDSLMNGQTGVSQGSLAGVSGANQPDFVTERSMRNSELVSHTDTILDMAMIEYRTQDATIPLLVSCSRDSTVKIWRC